MSDESNIDESPVPAVQAGMPVLPLRDVVVYPHMVIPLFVGREKSIVALDLGADIELFKSLINADPYTYASWTTIRGVGVCVIFRIDGKKHRESFEGIQQYIYEKYPEYSPNLDSSCINESRARFVSFDPYLFESHDPDAVPVFKQYPKKEKAQKIEKIIYVQSDFERIMQEIQHYRTQALGLYR